MQRFWITVCVLAGGASLVYGQLREPATIAAVDSRDNNQPAAAQSAAADAGSASQPAGEPGGLREQFVERMQRMAALMSEEELKTAIGAADADIRECEAEVRLQEIRQQLTDFASEYESTKAGKKARDMLQTGFRPL